MLSPRNVIACLLLLAPLGSMAKPSKKAPRYFLRISDTQEAMGVSSGLLEDARKILQTELGKRPDLVIDTGEAPQDEQALVSYLKQRGLAGYRVFVRLTHVGTQTLPPREGHQYKQLEAVVRASIVGTTLPGNSMAFGGDGESRAAAEISGKVADSEATSLKKDALADALSQAVDKALLQITKGFMKPPTEKQSRKKP